MKYYRFGIFTIKQHVLFLMVLGVALVGVASMMIESRLAGKSFGSILSLNTANQCDIQTDSSGVEVSGQNDKVFFVGCAGFF